MRGLSPVFGIVVTAAAVVFAFSCALQRHGAEEAPPAPVRAAYEPSGNALFDAVLERAAGVGSCEVLVVGDSLVEGLHKNYSGRDIFAAGVQGAGTADWLTYAPLLLRVIKPRTVILALGVNDSPRLRPDKLPDFFRRYEELCRLLSEGGAELAVSTMLPVHRGKGKKGRAAKRIDPAVLRRMNAGIVRIADARGYGVIHSFAAVADGAGMLPQPLTFDGIHLTKAGYERWEKVLFAGRTSS
ncbi:MAG: SGNH/GDSL hydrolase family protein [Desulfovibrio sp.]|jgi:lysophospholipase L1-like esterase|nr:SGNH/GDSL hydrolase family protein [Desulfovibrio sp.]